MSTKDNGQHVPETHPGGPVSERQSRDMISAAYLDAIVHYAETLLGIRLKILKKHRYSSPCPFHADTKDRLMVYVNKKDEVRFHCFGACKGDWNIYDVIMLRRKCRFKTAQQVWAGHLGDRDFKSYDDGGPCIHEPEEIPEPDDTVGFAEPKKLDEKNTAVLAEAVHFYNDLLMSNEDRFKPIWDYLARRGLQTDTIRRFNIGCSPAYGDDRHQGRALITSFSPRFEADYRAFDAFFDSGLVRFLNDATVKGYRYYCRQIDFTRKDQFSRNYSDYFAGRIVFPIYDADASLTGFVGRRPDDKGVRWLKQQNRDVALTTKGWLYGIEKAGRHIRHYRTIILVEGIFDYFAFYNLLREQGKAVVVSTLGSYLTPETASILKRLDIKHFIVAYDWDGLGRNGIERIAAKSGGWVYYLGGLAQGQDPYDMLKPVVSAISGFSLKQPGTDAPYAGGR